MQASTALSLPTRSAIVLIALLQGLLLYLASKAGEQPPLDSHLLQVSWNTLVLVIPTAIILSLQQLRDRTLWWHAALAVLPVLGVAAWTGWNLDGAAGLETRHFYTPFVPAMTIALCIALPWWQFRLQHGHWRAGYADLFEHAWQNVLTLALAGLFTGVTWLLLWLWQSLFMLVDIRLFRDLFKEAAFIWLATGLLLGFGVLIGRTQHRAIQITRQVLFALAKGLLPLLAFIAVIFLLSLPFTGLEPLWKTRSAASLLLVVAVLLVGLVNAVYQQGEAAAPYPVLLRRLVEASLVLLPVYTGLAVYAMGLRLHQYGWTIDRFWGLAAAVLMCGYALGYAVAVLRPGGRWMAPLEGTNRWMCWLVLAVALLGHSPVLDPVRLSIGSQLARLQADPPGFDDDDAMTLRFTLGRRGVDALRGLREAPGFQERQGTVALIDATLARRSRWGAGLEGEAPKVTLAQLQEQIVLSRGTASPDGSWWQRVLSGNLDSKGCNRVGGACVLLARDLDADGRDELLLCNTGRPGMTECQLYACTLDAWQVAGELTVWEGARQDREASRAALLDGNIRLHTRRWADIAIGSSDPRSITPADYTQDTP